MIAVLAAATLTLGLPSLFTDASAQVTIDFSATGGAGGAGGDAESSLIVDLTPEEEM